MNSRSLSHDSMKDAQNYQMKGNKLNCSDYRIQVKLLGGNLNSVRRETSRYYRNTSSQGW
jgi:hypothetical protein